MAGMTVVGGRVQPHTVALTSTAAQYVLEAVSNRILVQNQGSNAARIFFNAADAVAGSNYLTIAAGATFSEPVETESIWLDSPSGTTVCYTTFQRRG